MSTLPSNESRRSAKQPPSVYTVMLLLSMLFMAVAVAAMFIESQRWAPDYFRTSTARPSVMLMPAQPVHWA